MHLPVEALVVVFPIKKLNLLKSVRTGQVAAYRWVNRQKGVKCCGAGFLRPNHEKTRQLVAGFVARPNFLVPRIVAGILNKRQTVKQFHFQRFILE